MYDDEVRENEIAELRSQVALLESAKAEAEQAARKARLQLTILLLRLVSELGVYALMLEDGRAWELLSREEFLRREGRLPADPLPTEVKPSRKKAA
jgi:hypothetical protein